MFDEQQDGDPHGECAEEIARLKVANIKVVAELERLQADYDRLMLDAKACAATLNKVRDDLRAANTVCRNYELNYKILRDAIYEAMAPLEVGLSQVATCKERGCPQFGKAKASACGCQEKQ